MSKESDEIKVLKEELVKLEKALTQQTDKATYYFSSYKALENLKSIGDGRIKLWKLLLDGLHIFHLNSRWLNNKWCAAVRDLEFYVESEQQKLPIGFRKRFLI